jgi:hypothetical protein
MLLYRVLPYIIGFTALVARLVPGVRTIDDAYITFRYAQNLLLGHGLVYNPGEAVLGTSTPIYALVMSILGFFTGGGQAPFPTLALIVNGIADGLTCILLVRLGQALGYRRAGIAAAAIWAVAPWSVTFAIGGMETSLLILLGTATFYFYSSGKLVIAALCASLSLLTRPDALLFVLPLALERLRNLLINGIFIPRSRSELIREIGAFTLPGLLWTAYARLTYGSPIPNSVSAKVAAYRIPPEAGLVRFIQHYATPFLGHLTLGTWWIGLGVILFPVLFILGASKLVRDNIRTWPLMAYPWLYLLVFAIANPLIFRWYLSPPLPLYFLGIFIGGERVSIDLKSKLPIYILGIAALILTINGWTLHPDHGPNQPAPDMAYIELELLYQEVAEQLRPKLIAGQTVAAADVGAMGYFTQAPILDTLGLISPEAVAYYPLPENAHVINYAIPSELIQDLKPDYLVILEVYGRNTLLKDPLFLEQYELLQKVSTDIYGSEGMLIFRRRF